MSDRSWSKRAVWSLAMLAMVGLPVVGQVPSLPREQLDDPPASAATLSQQARSPRMLAVRGGLVSVQVNVDSKGDNIIGDAANEPSMAIDPTDPNKIAIGWRQFDTITLNFRQAGRAFSTDGGQNWTFPGVLDPGQFRSDPVLGSDAAGNFYYSSLSTLTTIEVFKSTDGGATWGTPVSAFGGDKQWIAVDDTQGIGAGNVYQVWNVQFSCCAPADFTRSTNGGASFQGPYVLPNPRLKWGTLDVAANGTLYAAGARLDQSGHLFGRSVNAQDPGATPIFDLMFGIDLGGAVDFGTGPNPGGLLGQVWVATDHSTGSTAGNVYVLQSVNPPGDDPLDVQFIRSEDGGFTWSDPVRVNDDSVGANAWQWFGTMSVAPGGRIDVVWNDTRTSGATNFSELYYSFSYDGGRTWAVNEPVSPMFNSFEGWPSQQKIGDYYHMISDNTGANVAYSATFNGEQDVYFLRIPANCDGTLPGAVDCNGNGIADACESDCDGNGVEDSCDCLTLAAPEAEETVIAKNRYLSFRTSNLGCRAALRIKFLDMPAPFDLNNGKSMWVGSVQQISENGGSLNPIPGFDEFSLATLQCSPLHRDWTDIQTLHVHHEFIVPGGLYAIQAVDEGCDLGDEGTYSAELAIETSRWGDVTAGCEASFCTAPDGSVNINDALSIVEKFVGAAGAPIKARADLEPSVADQTINVSDILASLSGFVGLPYPFVPSAFPCEN